MWYHLIIKNYVHASWKTYLWGGLPFLDYSHFLRRSKDDILPHDMTPETFLQYFQLLLLVLRSVRFPEQYSIFSARPQTNISCYLLLLYFESLNSRHENSWPIVANLCRYTSWRPYNRYAMNLNQLYNQFRRLVVFCRYNKYPCCMLFLQRSCRTVPRGCVVNAWGIRNTSLFKIRVKREEKFFSPLFLSCSSFENHLFKDTWCVFIQTHHFATSTEKNILD